MRFLLPLAALAVAGSLATGCMAPRPRHAGREYGWVNHRLVPIDGYETYEARRVAYVPLRAEYWPQADDGEARLPPRASNANEARVPFDSTAALAAIHAIDLAPCVARGAPRGYGHASVTFGAEGHATEVLIDAPSALAADAIACIGTTLGAASVPPFDGAPVRVGASYRVP